MTTTLLAATGDTWGIPSRTFLIGYLLAAIVTVLACVLIRRGTVHSADVHGAVPLNGPEIGMLSGDNRAIVAAMAQLRGDGLIDASGRPTGTRPVPLDPFTLRVFQALSMGDGNLRTLHTRLTGPLADLRASLEQRGMLAGRAEHAERLFTALPVLVLIGIGIVRIMAGSANGKPVGLLIVLVALLIIVALAMAIPRRRTRLGQLTLNSIMARSAHLSPRNRPSLASYGGMQAGVAAGLFGGAALWLLDPGLATAAGVSSSDGSGFLGGDSGGGCGGGGGDGGGGGGCGGGCGGCGG